MLGFAGDDAAGFRTAVLSIVFEKCSLVEKLLFSIFEFFLVAKCVEVCSVKVLITNRVFGGFEVVVRKEENVKRDLTEFEFHDRSVPV